MVLYETGVKGDLPSDEAAGRPQPPSRDYWSSAREMRSRAIRSTYSADSPCRARSRSFLVWRSSPIGARSTGGWSRKNRCAQRTPPPDYVGMGALVLAREMTWGPCIVPPKTPKDIYSWERTPQFRCLPGDSSGVVFNLLSIITSHRIQPLSALYCAPEFVDVSRGFGSGPLQLFRIDDSWPTEEFTPKHLSTSANFRNSCKRGPASTVVDAKPSSLL